MVGNFVVLIGLVSCYFSVRSVTGIQICRSDCQQLTGLDSVNIHCMRLFGLQNLSTSTRNSHEDSNTKDLLKACSGKLTATILDKGFCIETKEDVQENTYPLLFLADNKMGWPSIRLLDWTTGRKKRIFPVNKGGQITSLTCSDSDKKIYFVLRDSNRHIVCSINSKSNVTYLLNTNDGDTIAVDGRNHYVFVGSRTTSDINWRRSILRYDLSAREAIPQKFTFTQSLEFLIGIEAVPDRELIYIGTTTNIYTMKYTGQVSLYYNTWEPKISSIAYDPSSRFLYIQQQKDVKRFLYQFAELEQILACDEEPLAFDVNQDVVLLANRKAIWAVDLKSDTSRWSNSANGVPYITVC